MTFLLSQQQNKVYKGPIHTIPDAIFGEAIDGVKVYDNQGELVATMDYQTLEGLLEEFL